MKRILIETLFTVLITELTLVIILMILFSTRIHRINRLLRGVVETRAKPQTVR